jgi:hypothetical protein
MLIEELLTYLFDKQPHLLAEPMATWLASSRRFTEFVMAYRSKIRKKLHVRQDAESLLDLRLELETAYLLLQERALSVAYEPKPIGQVRGPDFAVAFTTSATFMVEVTRLRASDANGLGERLADAVCDKLGQLQPQCSNVLLIGLEAVLLSQEALHAVMRHLQQRAERNDPAVVQRHGFRDRADFFNHFQRLSEVFVQVGVSVVGWGNPQAKHPLPGKMRTALYRSHNAAYPVRVCGFGGN